MDKGRGTDFKLAVREIEEFLGDPEVIRQSFHADCIYIFFCLIHIYFCF